MPKFDGMQVQRKKTEGPTFKPGVSTAFAISVHNGKKPKTVIAHTDQMAHFGHEFFTHAGEIGIDMSKLISMDGKPSKALENFFFALKGKVKELSVDPAAHMLVGIEKQSSNTRKGERSTDGGSRAKKGPPRHPARH